MFGYLLSFLMSVQPVSVKINIHFENVGARPSVSKPKVHPGAGTRDVEPAGAPTKVGDTYELPYYLRYVMPSEQVREFFSRGK